MTMSKYAVIRKSDFNEREIEGDRTIVSEFGEYMIIECGDEDLPNGPKWTTFDGEYANVECAAFLRGEAIDSDGDGIIDSIWKTVKSWFS